ncbi:dihydrolipoyllysine-residue succinyltransferase component of 2-oxoglutarate dehydrogenase complex, mitochondrial-like isoform X1 [Convolutriloba macropyga]|uniref:dihydrolipoyllysine-residue succinyltransferase component of 2-oxoglutarate dehydrogenase complex, mitochondrial-like isoform X1 n=1 Tax=Convolutriloba macropyga TaxID=536237 RepID=UPI003F524C7F
MSSICKVSGRGAVAARRCLSVATHARRHQQHTRLVCCPTIVCPINSFKFGIRHLHQTGILFGDIHTIQTPAFAESVTSGDLKWVKEVGDTVMVDEMIAEVETDKTSVPINSPVSGSLKEILVQDGESVEAHQDIAQVEEGEVAAAPAEVAPKASEPVSETSSSESAAKAEKIEPPKQVPPMPKAPISSTPVADIKPIEASKPGVNMVGGFSRTETRVKMNRMRLKIAKRLKEAQNTAAMLTTFNEIDMSNAIELRKQNKDMFLKKHDLKLTFMSAFLKASVYALKDSPAVNAVIDDNSNDIVYRDYIDISVAVSTPKGLVVPVLRNCNEMNYVEIERGLATLAQRARNNELAIEDMDGGTFTISNGGVFGSLFGTPILNPPQSAILGMHAINERPVAIDGKVEIRPMMFVALTYDHRLLDGREAVLFLRKIKTAVEDPRMMLLDL